MFNKIILLANNEAELFFENSESTENVNLSQTSDSGLIETTESSNGTTQPPTEFQFDISSMAESAPPVQEQPSVVTSTEVPIKSFFSLGKDFEQNTTLMIVLLVFIFAVMFILIAIYLKLNSQLTKTVSMSSLMTHQKKRRKQNSKEIIEAAKDANGDNNQIKQEDKEEEFSSFAAQSKEIYSQYLSDDFVISDKTNLNIGTPNSLRECVKNFLEKTKYE